MKNKTIQKFAYVLVALFISFTVSCDSDDDLPVGPVISVNQFCYGLDAANSFITAAAYNFVVVATSADVYRTTVIITDDNLMVDNNGEVMGAGSRIDVALYGDRNTAFQSGTYIIGDTEDVGDVVVTYSPNYDSAVPLNRSLRLTGGLVGVSPHRNGYAIEIDGEDENGDRFHGIYLGTVDEIN